MRRKDVPEEIALAAIAKFRDAKLVDDARYAQMYVRSAFQGKTIAAKNIRTELKQKGISEENIQQALSQIDQNDEKQAAIDYAVKKVERMKGMEREVIYRRLYAQLIRRGFSFMQTKTALEHAFAQLDDLSALR